MSVSDLKLIHAGKVLENNKTLADSRITFGDIPGDVVTMHVVVQPRVTKKKTGFLQSSTGKYLKPSFSIHSMYPWWSTFCFMYLT